MKRTSYQIMHQAPEQLAGHWTVYKTLPATRTQELAQDLLRRHLAGEYKPNQLKSWLLNHRFKVVKVTCEYQDVA